MDADTAVRAQVRLYDYLFLEQEDGSCVTNESSMTILPDVMVEPHIKGAAKGDRFQFMRQGYFCIDPVDTTDSDLVFNQIVSLKDSFAKQVLKGN